MLASRVSTLLKGGPSGSTDTASEGDLAAVQPRELYIAALQVIELYYRLFADAVGAEGFDVLRLVDDLAGFAAPQASLESIDQDLTLSALSVVRQGFDEHGTHIFGTREDFTKLLTNAIVLSDWESGMKRSPLTKLLLLLSSSSSEVAKTSRRVLEEALSVSGLFEGHQLSDHELSLEMSVWLDLCTSSKAAIVLEILLRFAHHWAVEICLLVADFDQRISFERFGGLAPVSPVLCAGIMLLSFDFSLLKTGFPTHIARTLDADGQVVDEAFFDKFRTGFHATLATVIEHLVVVASPQTRCAEAYLSLVLKVAESHGRSKAFSEPLCSACKILLQLHRKEYDHAPGKLSPRDHLNTVTAASFATFAAEISNFLSIPEEILIHSPWRTVWKEVYVLSDPERSDRSELLQFVIGLLEYETKGDADRSLHDASTIQLVHVILKVLDETRNDAALAVKVIDLSSALIKRHLKAHGARKDTISALDNGHLIDYLLKPNSVLGAPIVRMFSDICSSTVAKTQSGRDLMSRISESFHKEYVVSKREVNPDIFALASKIQNFIRNPQFDMIFAEQALVEAVEAKAFSMSNGVGKKVDCVAPLETDPTVANAIFACPISVLIRIVSQALHEERNNDEFNALTKLCFKFNDDGSIGKLFDPTYAYASAAFNEELKAADKLHHLSLSDSSIRRVMQTWNMNSVADAIGSPTQNILPTLALKDRQHVLSEGGRGSISNSVDVLNLVHSVFQLDPQRSQLYTPLLLDLFRDQELCSNRLSLNTIYFMSRCRPDLRAAWLERVLLAPILSESLDHASDASIDRWRATLVKLLETYTSSLSNSLKEMKLRQDTGQSSRPLTSMEFQFKVVADILGILMTPLLSENLASSKDELYHAFGKFVRNLLKYSISEPLVFEVISFCMEVKARPETLGGFILLADVENGWNSPVFFLKLILGHSQYQHSLQSSTLPMLELLLMILSHIVANNADLDNDDVTYLITTIVGLYSFSLSRIDRIIFRIVDILCYQGMCAPLYLLAQSRGASPHMSSDWLLSLPSTPIVYSTLANFPDQRTARSLPFPFEHEGFQRKQLVQSREMVADCLEYWRSADSQGDVEHEEMLPGLTSLADYDILYPADKIYDPAFWIPALLYTLRADMVSVRLLANSGLLSLVLMTLSSDCFVLRSYARACLHFVSDYIQKQTPESDAAFRDRHQLMVLIDFVKNSGDSTCRKIPSVVALFLSRGALHLLQPQHELYGKINKYLLSRPLCDVKDIPLYELVMHDHLEESSHSTQRLAVLRFLRDGLRAKEDHINLCRKHVYSRLMLLFPVLAQDNRAGHAIIDLFDRALTFPFSAKYLISRCAILEWIRITGSPRRPTTSTKEDDFLSGAPPKIIARIPCLLRRCVQVGFLLGSDLGDTTWRQIFLIIKCFIESTFGNPLAEKNYEYSRQILLCMWDYTLCVTSSFDKHLRLYFDMGDISKMTSIVSQLTTGKEKSEFILSTLALARFSLSADGINEDTIDMILFSFTDIYITHERKTEKVYVVSSIHGKRLMKNEDCYSFVGTIMTQEEEILRSLDVDVKTSFTWRALQSTNLSATPLPTSLGLQFLTPLIAHVILKFLRNAALEPSRLLRVLRWSLVMMRVYEEELQLTQSMVDTPLKQKIAVRLLHIFHRKSCDYAIYFAGIYAFVLSKCEGLSLFEHQFDFNIQEDLSRAAHSLSSEIFLAVDGVKDGGMSQPSRGHSNIAATIIVLASMAVTELDNSAVNGEGEGSYLPKLLMRLHEQLEELDASEHKLSIPETSPVGPVDDIDTWFETTASRPPLFMNEPRYDRDTADASISLSTTIRNPLRERGTAKLPKGGLFSWSPIHMSLKRGIGASMGSRKRLRLI